jgi:predicted MPP superfamily phosphohydrolase
MPPLSKPCSRRTAVRAVAAGAGLVAVGLPLAGTLDGLLATPQRLETSDHSFGSPGPAGTRLRVVQLSDLHLSGFGPLEQAVLEQVHDSRADLITITGDAIDRRRRLPALELLLRELPRGPRILAIPGNWEHWSGIPLDTFARLYDRHGVELLVNRSVEIDKNGARVRVTGLDDLVGGTPDAAAALRDARPAPHHLVLAHCPKARDTLVMPAEHPVSLLLCGHTHGGQIAPFHVAVWRPWGSGRYLAGWYRDGGPPMYVSRGVGTSIVPMRIGSTPELVRIDWSLG